jgi:hypothetical protein
MFRIVITMLVVLMLLTISCANPPNQSIKAADAALARLRELGAHNACPDSFRSAENHLAKARQAMEGRAYETAKTEVFEALRLADQTRDCASEAGEKTTADGVK